MEHICNIALQCFGAGRPEAFVNRAWQMRFNLGHIPANVIPADCGTRNLGYAQGVLNPRSRLVPLAV